MPMTDLSKIPTEELERIARGETSSQPDISSVSASELRKIAAQGEDIGKAESAGRGLLQGFALGYAPQVIAGYKSLTSDKKYGEELEAQKIAQEAAWEKHPYAYGAGFAAPAVASLAASAPVSIPARIVSAAPNIATLAGRAISSIPGIRGAGALLEKPIVQGAIYGSSEGETPEERLKSAGIGAASAKIGEKIIPPVLSATGAIASGIGSRVSRLISGSPSGAKVAADIAAKHDISLPAVVDAGPITRSMSSVDIGKHIANSSAKTLNETGEKFADYAGTATAESAGQAIKTAFSDWLRNGSRQELNSIYQPVNQVLSDQSKHYPINLFKLRIAKESELGNIADVSPLFSDVNKALAYASKSGMTIGEMKNLRKIVSDAINFNKINPTQGVDEKILREIRNSLTQDMLQAANSIGGNTARTNLANADKLAHDKIYSVQEQLSKILGSGLSADSKSASGVYNNLAKMSRDKSANTDVLQKIKNVVDPQAWDEFSKAWVNYNIVPQSKFSFGNYSSAYNTTSKKAMDIIFGQSGSSPFRNYMDDMHKFSNLVGRNLDQHAQRAVSTDAWGTAASLAPYFEAAVMGGLPLKSITGIVGSSMAGKYLSRNIAEALPPPNVRQNFFSYIKSNPQAASMYMNLMNMAQMGGNKINSREFQNNLKTLYGMSSAALGKEFNEAALNSLILAGGMVASGIGERLPFQAPRQADGGRVARASGGRIMHEDASDKLIRAVEIARKGIGKQTEEILNKPDEHVVQALAVANRHI